MHLTNNSPTKCLFLLKHNLDIDVGLNGDGGDLLDSLRGGVQIDDALVYAHLPAVPGVGTLTARGLADSQAQHLGGHADGTAHLQTLLIASTPDEIGANLTIAEQCQSNRQCCEVYHIAECASAVYHLRSVRYNSDVSALLELSFQRSLSCLPCKWN